MRVTIKGQVTIPLPIRQAETWRLWLEGRKATEIFGTAERLFPLLRPLALYWGNRWAKDVAL